MIYTSDFFSGQFQRKDLKFTIADKDIENIYKLKSSSDEESGYYHPMITWKLEDNPHISNEYELSRLSIAMQFISMIGDVNEDLVKKHDLNALGRYKLILLKSLYIDGGDEPNIQTAYKRPFGNSSVLSDVMDVATFCGIMPAIDDENYSKYESIAQEYLENFMNFLVEFFNGGFTLKWRSFSHQDNKFFNREKIRSDWENIGLKKCWRTTHYIDEWFVDISELREIKIVDILN